MDKFKHFSAASNHRNPKFFIVQNSIYRFETSEEESAMFLKSALNVYIAILKIFKKNINP